MEKTIDGVKYILSDTKDKLTEGDLFYHGGSIRKCKGISQTGLIKYNSGMSISGDDRVSPSLCRKVLKTI